MPGALPCFFRMPAAFAEPAFLRIRNMFLRESGNSHSTVVLFGRFKNDGNASQVVQCVFYLVFQL